MRSMRILPLRPRRRLAPRVRAAAIVVAIAVGLSLIGTASRAATVGPVVAPRVAIPPSAAARVAPPIAEAVARVRANFTPANRRYARVRQGLALADPFWDLAFALLLLATGASARIRARARRLFRRRYGCVLVYVAVVGLAWFVWRLPLDGFRGFWWEHRFGLSNQTALAWFTEQVKALGLDIACFGVTGILALALWGIETAGRRWWLWLAAGTLPVLIAAVLLQPLVFEPAFNQFKPLGDARLDHDLLALGARAGIPARHVFQVDRSRQTRTVNAYVSGFGPSQRIVLWDTTLERLSHDEILFVMGHEMGHYRLGHLWQGVGLAWLASFGLFFAASRLLDRALARFGRRWGVTSLADEAALPLIAGVLGLLLTLAQPAANAWSRRIEHEADAYGIEATRLNAAAASTFIAFGTENRSDPDPPAPLRILLYTHPPLVERVRFALEYRPWERGGRNRYYAGPPPGAE